MNFRFNRFWFLSVAVAVLLGFYLVDLKLAQKRELEQSPSEKILTLGTGEEVKGLTLRGKTSEIEIQKKGGNWVLLKPIEYPAEQFMVEGMLSALKVGVREESFPLEEMSLGDMGLDRPGFVLEIVLNPGEKTRALEFGEENPVSRLTYARWGDEKNAFMVSEPYVKSLDKDLFSLRKKKLLDGDFTLIDSIEGKFGDKTFLLSRKGEDWKLTKPEEKDADSNEVRDYVDELNSLYVREFLDELDPKNPDLGLSDGKNFVRLTSERKEWKILIGNENQEKQAYYALKEGEKGMVLISSPRITPLIKTHDRFLPRYLFGLEWQKLKGLRIQQTGSELELVRTGNEWKLESGALRGSSGLQERVGDLIEFLSGMKYETLVAKGKPFKEEPSLSLSLSKEGGESFEVSFFEEKDRTVAQVRKVSQVYEVSRFVMDELRDYIENLQGVS